VSNVGVVIGRFQTPFIHEGHELILKEALLSYSKQIILIGVAPFRSKANPLPFSARESMLKQWFYKDTGLVGIDHSHVQILPLFDMPTDEQWSEQIDTILRCIAPFDKPTLLHSREGFGESYKGKHKVVKIDSTIPYVSASVLREQAAKAPIRSYENRMGYIAAVEQTFTFPQPCVDIALVQQLPPHGPDMILLGKKEGEQGWRLPGGCVDVTDTSLEQAAARELLEETGLTCEGGLKYIGSAPVKDWRARGTELGIMTSLFVGDYSFGAPVGGDDLKDVYWAYLDEAHEEMVKEHIPLLEMVRDYVYKK
jgi:bifunctional NMN adenylyltransferase/nudix hydrolase